MIKLKPEDETGKTITVEEKGHGRIEKRRCFKVSDISWVEGVICVCN
jgi:hypothetical protein